MIKDVIIHKKGRSMPVIPTVDEVICTKCGREVCVTTNSQRLGLDTECPDPACPVAADHPPSAYAATCIYFADESE
jgi:hypothetical protein